MRSGVTGRTRRAHGWRGNTTDKRRWNSILSLFGGAYSWYCHAIRGHNSFPGSTMCWPGSHDRICGRRLGLAAIQSVDAAVEFQHGTQKWCGHFGMRRSPMAADCGS
jgi:hypothetical protein